MQSAGVVFPPREENSSTLFTSPHTHPISQTTFPYEDVGIDATLESDASGLRYTLLYLLASCTYLCIMLRCQRIKEFMYLDIYKNRS